MHIHILGICGTFMGSLAVLAKEMGLKVTGCDQAVYPPMSTQLENQGIELISGYDITQLELDADLYVIGNAISRGNPLLEEILNNGLPYTSGPAFLADKILPGKWVLGVSGTHGKTTTSSMLAWILEHAGMAPGFLIGGVPDNFSCSARLGNTPFFVIEADEYDSAFFDKRSKFVHYRPRTFIVNNLEFDHADIFADLAAIQTQFHHVIRTIPSNGRVIYPANVASIEAVMDKGCWSEQQCFQSKKSVITDDENKNEKSVNQPVWSVSDNSGSGFTLELGDERVTVEWSLTGDHNIENGVAALLAARHVGVSLQYGAEALSCFKGVKRRMQKIAQHANVTVYDDFAHHPTAIKTTLAGLRRSVGETATIVALIEPRSNTMRMGVHVDTLLKSAEDANVTVWADLAELSWLEKQIVASQDVSFNSTHLEGTAINSTSINSTSIKSKHLLGRSIDELIEKVLSVISGETHIVIMSNGGFSGIHQLLVSALKETSHANH